MKIFLFIFISFFTFTCNAQQLSESEIKQQLESLNSKTSKSRDSIFKIISLSNDKLKATKVASEKEQLDYYIDNLYNISDRNDVAQLKANLNFTKKHPYSLYSFQLVQQEISRQPGKNFYDEYEAIYKNASPEVKNSESGKKMADQLKYFKQSKVGSIAPLFSGNDINGKPIALSGFKGKYVLIDFWASWCAPCREELPYIKKAYAKYKELGFEIISVSIDSDLERLKTAISKEDISNWKHFSIAQNNTKIEKDYFLNGIPHKILIDKKGKIIGKWKGSGNLTKIILENLLKDLFE